jgi:hypothetical protein
MLMPLERRSAYHRVKQKEYDDGAHHGHEQAPEIKAPDFCRPERGEEPPAKDTSDSAQDNVSEQSLAGLIDEHAPDPACHSA